MINLVALNTKLNDKIRNSIALFITASHGFLVGKTFSIFLFANQATKAIFVGFLVGKTIFCFCLFDFINFNFGMLSRNYLGSVGQF